MVYNVYMSKYIQLNENQYQPVFLRDDGTLWTTMKTSSPNTVEYNNFKLYQKKVRIGTDGYPATKTQHRYVPIHRLVATHFVPVGRPDQIEVNHIDGNKLNNDYRNLEWVNRRENIEHAKRNGLLKARITEYHTKWVCEFCGRKPVEVKLCVREDNDIRKVVYYQHGNKVKQTVKNPKHPANM
mgnify:CR=1 FL=1